ncbi:MAG: 6-phosphogluconolactonase [Deltaproteobacteria bacterium]|nr:6-phosphogluconolactonase [Deltaproteobacteria bacterium]
MSFKPKIIIKDDPILLAKQAAEIFVAGARRSVGQRGRLAVALSGGSTPRRMHKMLASEPYILNIPWGKIHIFWVDERCVLQDSHASNYGTAKRDFINAVPISETQVHLITCESSPRVSAKEYQKILSDFFSFESSRIPRFDLIYLGMGADGHIASLFPGQKALYEKEKLVVAVKGGDPNMNRISMTLPLLNQARHIVFLITGAEKARTVQTVLEDRKIRLPAQKIIPLNGQLTWLLDRGAASLLSGDLHHDKVNG